MAIVSKLRQSFEATKQSYEAWAALGICAAISVAFFLCGLAIWITQQLGALASCLLLGTIFALLALGVKLFIDAKARVAQQRFASARQELSQDVAIATAPFRSPRSLMTSRTVVPLGIIGLLLLLAFSAKEQHDAG
jgi:hypothetical protein